MAVVNAMRVGGSDDCVSVGSNGEWRVSGGFGVANSGSGCGCVGGMSVCGSDDG